MDISTHTHDVDHFNESSIAQVDDEFLPILLSFKWSRYYIHRPPTTQFYVKDETTGHVTLKVLGMHRLIYFLARLPKTQLQEYTNDPGLFYQHLGRYIKQIDAIPRIRLLNGPQDCRLSQLDVRYTTPISKPVGTPADDEIANTNDLPLPMGFDDPSTPPIAPLTKEEQEALTKAASKRSHRSHRCQIDPDRKPITEADLDRLLGETPACTPPASNTPPPINEVPKLGTSMSTPPST